MKEMEIWFTDLSEEAQIEFISIFGNYEDHLNVPIFIYCEEEE